MGVDMVPTTNQNLKVEVHTGHYPGGPHPPNGLPRAHGLARNDVDRGEVAVIRVDVGEGPRVADQDSVARTEPHAPMRRVVGVVAARAAPAASGRGDDRPIVGSTNPHVPSAGRDVGPSVGLPVPEHRVPTAEVVAGGHDARERVGPCHQYTSPTGQVSVALIQLPLPTVALWRLPDPSGPMTKSAERYTSRRRCT